MAELSQVVYNPEKPVFIAIEKYRLPLHNL